MLLVADVADGFRRLDGGEGNCCMENLIARLTNVRHRNGLHQLRRRRATLPGRAGETGLLPDDMSGHLWSVRIGLAFR